MVHMRVRDEYPVNRWQIGQLNTGLTQPLDDYQPVSKIWINQKPLSAQLQEKPRVPDKRES